MNRTMSADLAGAHLAVVRRYGDRRPEFPACVIDWGRSDTATRQLQDAVGFVLIDDEHGLTLAMEVVDPESRQERPEYRAQLAIPASAIVRRAVVGEGRPG